MNILLWLVMICICFIIFRSMMDFIQEGKVGLKINLKDSRFSTELFYALLIIYTIVLIGFGLIYFILSFQTVILVDTEAEHSIGIMEALFRSLYFSGVTLMTIGYGDIVPVGLGRLIAVVESLIGYVLPTAFVLRLVQARNREAPK